MNTPKMSPLQALKSRTAGAVLGVFLTGAAISAAHANPADIADTMNGTISRAALETLLANGYCPLIVDPGLVEMGVHQQGTRTWVLLAAQFAPAQGQDDGGLASRMLWAVNETRAHGRNCGGTFFPATKPVVWNEALARAAQAHSEDMARNNYFGHESRDGATPSDRVMRAGYDFRGTAENIAAGQMTLEAAMAGWVSSPGHCANLMDADYTEMGAALASNRRSQMGAYWTQVFGVPRGARPAKPPVRVRRAA